MDQKKAIGQRIRALREKSGMFQADIAEKLGMERPTYSNYELGRTAVPHNVLTKIATIFMTSTDYLLGKTENPDPVGSELSEIPIEELILKNLTWKGKRLTEDQKKRFAQFVQAGADLIE